ncbi:MAG: class I SAM-dependent methyltransferase [Gammaproteobacteria bacterium]|nr:class I SAM-dependent methyltransferase [Gammaproteobacteria bacterium]
MLNLLSEVVLYAHPLRQQEAERIAQRLNLPLGDGQRKNKYRLYLGPEKLELQNLEDRSFAPAFVDFVEGRARHRRLFGGGKGQPLARAVGIKGSRLPRVLDATAGFGRDAFVLASLGCQVTLLERSPVFAALLADALERAALNIETAEIVKRMNLQCVDAQHYLNSLPDNNLPEAVYLDPMYPHRNKTALVKKEMRIARELAGDDEDAAAVLDMALSRTTSRVVVKRPRTAATLNTIKPTTVIQSENTRYDIYITTAR